MINKMFSNFRHRYNQHIYSQSRHFLIRGLRTKGTFAITLDQAFLQLNLTFSHHPQQPPIAPKFFQAILGKRSIWDFLRIGRRHKRKKALIFTVLGSQGSGKTTLLQHLALILASGKQRRYRVPASVPILLSLPAYLNKILINNDKQPTLAELLENHFHQTSNQRLTAPTHWFEHQLKKGRCFIMLDSFDRVGDEKRRQQVATWLEAQFLNYPRCSFIITARPQGYPSLQAAHILEIQSLETQQIPQFIETWTLAHEATSRFDHGALQRAKQAAKEFTSRVDSAPELLDLATNPLSLTLMAILHREKKQSPLHWLDLYAKTCQLLLEHWGVEKEISDRLNLVQQQAVLQKIALAMLQHQTTQIPPDTANALVAKSLIQYGLIEKVANQEEKMTLEPEDLAAGEKFLLEIQNNNGLLIQSDNGSWHFVHQTFQEYLAANQLTTQSLTPENWFQWVNDSWWYDTLRFYISQCQDVTPIIQACLNNDNISASTLAALTLEIAPNKINQTLQQEITRRFINDLEVKDIKRRRLAAQFLLNYRLHHLQLIKPNENITKNHKYIEIDSSYLTNAEYQLFLDELYAQGYPHQPDQCTEYHFSPGSAQQPITGIRAEDAAAFCNWLTQKQEGKIIYRLPYPMEAKTTPPTLLEEELATWCQNPYKKRIYGLIWQSKVEEQRISSQLKNFSHLPLSTKSYALVNGEELLRALNKIPANVRDAEITQLLTQIITLIPLLLLRDLEITLNLPFILKLALNLDHTNLDDSIYAALYQNDLPAAQQIAKTMQSDAELARQRLGILLDNLLAFALATHSLSLRQALRKYTVELTQAVWTRLNELEQQQKPPLWQRYPTLYAKEKKLILNLHWWLRVVIAREEGQLPAWEGIRLVRERQIQ
jgi:energy-coupling factor transporter ATP-binding protein EcfA2